jgi:uncharacterized protein
METKPPLPPFTRETAKAKVQAAEDAWNTRDPERVALAYTEDSQWRNQAEFFSGRTAIKKFLKRKWAKELDYRLKKELWCFMDNRIAVRFEYELNLPNLAILLSYLTNASPDSLYNFSCRRTFAITGHR